MMAPHVEYDKLLVATGSSPFVPPIEGLNKATEYIYLLNWDSVKADESCC